MAILNNVFGNGDDESNSNSNDSSASGGVVGDATAALGLDYQTNSSQTDEDGETTSSSNDGAFGADLDTDSLLGGAGQSSSDSMTDTESN